MAEDYFDLIPVINEENTWSVDINNNVIISAKKKGIVNKIAIKYFKKPEKREIELDGYGSIVWRKINGKKSIHEIVEEIIRELGEEREFARQRAAMFFEMLRFRELILFAE